MALMQAPDDSTGWGLFPRTRGTPIYGGAFTQSAEHPIRVREHYRAPWGSKVRRRRTTSTRQSTKRTLNKNPTSNNAQTNARQQDASSAHDSGSNPSPSTSTRQLRHRPIFKPPMSTEDVNTIVNTITKIVQKAESALTNRKRKHSKFTYGGTPRKRVRRM